MATPLRVLVVDDSLVFRKVVRDILSESPDVEVVGVAANGAIALEKVEQLKPDLLTLDIKMPIVDGLEVLDELQQRGSQTGVIVLSASTAESARQTTAALELGAFDFVLKPAADSPTETVERLRSKLLLKVEAFQRQRKPSQISRTNRCRQQDTDDSLIVADAVAIGVSTGGPAALMHVLPKLPADLPVPVFVVQHMPPVFTATLAKNLDRACNLPVHEVHDCQHVEPGIYIAPGGKQTRVRRIRESVAFRVTDDPPEKNCRPSVDYLFRSVAEAYGGNTLGVIMTGMGDDGTDGCRALKARGSRVVVQDEATSVVHGMPGAVIKAGLADMVYPLERLSAVIEHSARKRELTCG